MKSKHVSTSIFCYRYSAPDVWHCVIIQRREPPSEAVRVFYISLPHGPPAALLRPATVSPSSRTAGREQRTGNSARTALAPPHCTTRLPSVQCPQLSSLVHRDFNLSRVVWTRPVRHQGCCRAAPPQSVIHAAVSVRILPFVTTFQLE